MKDEIPTVTISKKIKKIKTTDPKNVWEPRSQKQKRKILC
jgi:hypothetical protein